MSNLVKLEGINYLDPVQFDSMQRVCGMLINSDLVPDTYKAKENTPEAKAKAIANSMIALEISQRIGASPLMVMQNMSPIYGRPSWSAKFLIATVNTCGRFNPLQYKFTSKDTLGEIEYTDYEWKAEGGRNQKVAVKKVFDGTQIENIECVAYTTAKGSDDILESSPVSLAMAIKEGWYLKNGSKWQTMPKQMLIYRTASFWTSAYAPEISMGMSTVEEVEDTIDIAHEDVSDTVKKEIDSLANQETMEVKTTPTATLINNKPKDSVKKDEKKVEPTNESNPKQNNGMLF